MSQKLGKTELFAQWMGGNMVIADQGLSTGRRIWVHSGTGTDQGGSGANPDDPLATLDYAVGLCTANKGDIIYLMPGHSETRTTTGELADLDIAGIIIQGLGVGADRPTFTLTHAGAKITVDGASITIRNIRVAANIANVAQALDVGAAADGLTIEDCEFEDGALATKELTVAIAIAAACDDVTIRNCRFLTVEGGTITSAITFEGTHDNCHVVNNYFNGDFGTAAIVGTVGAGTRMLIADNWIKTKDGEPGIELKTDTTGVISRNHIESTGIADADNAIAGADCSWFQNYCVVTDGAAAEMVGGMPAESVEGKIDTIDSWDVRTVKKTDLALDAGGSADVFTVNNGPVELLGLIMHTTEAVSANACNTRWQSDPTIGAANTDLCGNVDITGMALGSSLYIDGPSASAGVIAANATAQPEMCDAPQVVMPGGIDLVQANSDPTSGIADVYLVYRPLVATATVTV